MTMSCSYARPSTSIDPNPRSRTSITTPSEPEIQHFGIYAHGAKHDEPVGWSQVRFANYALIRVEVRPGALVSEMDVVAVDDTAGNSTNSPYRRQGRA
jgi:hypothetical protein